jgi:DNA-binding transcriptional regulator YhcF (GntR family)
VRLDPDSRAPASEQVRAGIARAVRLGRLSAGERLPTVRELAADLGLAVNTVARAYRKLESDGLVAAQGRRGTFVVDLLPISPREAETRLAVAARAYARRARQLGADERSTLRALRRALEQS